MAQYRLWRIALAVVPRLPMPLARRLFTAIGLFAWMFGGRARRRAERNLRHIPALAANTTALRDAVRGVFVTSALNYLDMLRGRGLSDAEIAAGWTVENEELMREVVAQGKGLVILTGHFGNFEYAASRLGAIGYRTITPVERIKPDELFDLFCRSREHHNLHLVPADRRDALREIVEWLRGGGVLVIAGDRHIVGSGARIPFFGEPCTLATASIGLALRTGAPILTAFSWRTGPGTSYGIFRRLEWDRLAPAEATAASGDVPASTSDAAGARTATNTRTRPTDEVLPAMRAFVSQLEDVIAAHPESWVSALAPVWEADAPAMRTPESALSSDTPHSKE